MKAQTLTDKCIIHVQKSIDLSREMGRNEEQIKDLVRFQIQHLNNIGAPHIAEAIDNKFNK